MLNPTDIERALHYAKLTQGLSVVVSNIYDEQGKLHGSLRYCVRTGKHTLHPIK